MTLRFLLRSVLTLLCAGTVAGFAMTRAASAPRSALSAALAPNVDRTPLLWLQQLHVRRAVSSPVVVKPGIKISLFPAVRGHIFYVDVNHNLRFITGQAAAEQFTGENSSVAPMLSPDGTILAWVDFRRNYSDIWLTRLRYRPDGSVVAISSRRLTDDQSPPRGLERVAQPEGVYDPRYEWWAIKPSWLPDGHHLVFVSDRPGFNPSFQENATGAIWEQGITDTMTNAVQLTTPAPGTGGHDSPVWRPHDPTVFLYVNYYKGPDLPTGEGIIQAAMAVTGTAPVRQPIGLTPHGAVEYQPAWSPDSRYIAFVEDRGRTHTDLRIMPFHRPGYAADYARAITLVKGAPYVAQPFWSPDGRYLGYLASGGTAFSLVLRRITHVGGAIHIGPPVHITQASDVGADYRPTWGP